MEMNDIGLVPAVEFPEIIHGEQVIEKGNTSLQMLAMHTLYPVIKHVPHLTIALTRSNDDIVIVANAIGNVCNNRLGTTQLAQCYDL
jgi:hypothetical protein